jgi:hypothetical protein
VDIYNELLTFDEANPARLYSRPHEPNHRKRVLCSDSAAHIRNFIVHIDDVSNAIACQNRHMANIREYFPNIERLLFNIVSLLNSYLGPARRRIILEV